MALRIHAPSWACFLQTFLGRYHAACANSAVCRPLQTAHDPTLDVDEADEGHGEEDEEEEADEGHPAAGGAGGGMGAKALERSRRDVLVMAALVKVRDQME